MPTTHKAAGQWIEGSIQIEARGCEMESSSRKEKTNIIEEPGVWQTISYTLMLPADLLISISSIHRRLQEGQEKQNQGEKKN